MNKSNISAKFPFESHYITVHGSKIHYLDIGKGDPILFLHGNPSSSYLWRNIIPHVVGLGRVIAPDLIGMGKSDKPNISYRFQDHYHYLKGFIDTLGLENITLVIHDWGSALGFHYAHQHSQNIKAIAFMEAMLRPLNWSDFDTKFRPVFKMMRMPVVGWLMVSVANLFIKQVVPQAVVRELSLEEKEAYAAPYPTIASRKPVRVWPCEIPIAGKPVETFNIIQDYNRWLQDTDIPKLMFYAHPGATTTAETAVWAQEHLPNLHIVDVGEGTHYIQEDHPHLIGSELARWITNASQTSQPSRQPINLM